MRLAVFLAFFLALVEVAPADASYLYWRKVIGISTDYSKCMDNAARNNGLSNVRRSEPEVTGTSIDGKAVYVSITCIPRGGNQRAIMMIMGVGDNFAFTKGVVDSTADTVRTNRGPSETD
jgi:hypothetical protein